MKTTRILVSEHRLIEQVLNCLERMVERCASQRELEDAPARDAIVFFRGFTERCHYNKEKTELLETTRSGSGQAPPPAWAFQVSDRSPRDIDRGAGFVVEVCRHGEFSQSLMP